MQSVTGEFMTIRPAKDFILANADIIGVSRSRRLLKLFQATEELTCPRERKHDPHATGAIYCCWCAKKLVRSSTGLR